MAFNKKIRTGRLCAFNASKRGYYDCFGFSRITEGHTNINKEMVTYTLPNITFSNANNRCMVTFNRGELPNYTILPYQVLPAIKAGTTCLYPNGTGNIEVRDDGVLDNLDDSARGINYNVYIKNGKPLLTLANNVEGGVYCGVYRIGSHTAKRVYQINCNVKYAQLAGTSLEVLSIASGYMDALYSFPDQDDREFECDVILKCKTSSSLSGQQRLIKIGSYWFGINAGKFAFAALSSVVNGVAAEPNTSYWIRIMQTGVDVANYTLLYLEDDGTYTFDTLPDKSQWQIGAWGQFTSWAAHNSSIRFSNAANPWLGTIDVLNCRVYLKYVDESAWNEVWRAVKVIN